MGTEIERKYRVLHDGYRNLGTGTHFRQGFLSNEKARVVRVRIADKAATLTIKGATVGLTRSEFEYAIPLADAEALLKLCIPPLIEKTRWRVPFSGWIWEVDEFHGENEGLVVAEIELPAEDTPHDLPDFIGQEVTFDPRYYNSNLVKHPYRDWADRA